MGGKSGKSKGAKATLRMLSPLVGRAGTIAARDRGSLMQAVAFFVCLNCRRGKGKGHEGPSGGVPVQLEPGQPGNQQGL